MSIIFAELDYETVFSQSNDRLNEWQGPTQRNTRKLPAPATQFYFLVVLFFLASGWIGLKQQTNKKTNYFAVRTGKYGSLMNSAQPTVATFIYTSRAKCSPGCSFRPKKNINGYICTMNNGSNMVPNSIKSIPLNISIIGLWLLVLPTPLPLQGARGGCVRSI